MNKIVCNSLQVTLPNINFLVMVVPLYMGSSLAALATTPLAVWVASAMSLNAALACNRRTVVDNTLLGCLLLAAVAEHRACSNMCSWFSVFTERNDTISSCCGACATSACR